MHRTGNRRPGLIQHLFSFEATHLKTEKLKPHRILRCDQTAPVQNKRTAGYVRMHKHTPHTFLSPSNFKFYSGCRGTGRRTSL